MHLLTDNEGRKIIRRRLNLRSTVSTEDFDSTTDSPAYLWAYDGALDEIEAVVEEMEVGGIWFDLR